MRSGAIWNDLSRDKDLKNKVSVKLNARENRVLFCYFVDHSMFNFNCYEDLVLGTVYNMKLMRLIVYFLPPFFLPS